MSKEKSKEKSDNKSFVQKWWFWVIIAIIVIGIGSGSSNKDPQKVGDNNSSTSQTTTNNSSSNSDSSEKDTFAVGDVISYDNKEITVTKVQRNYNTGNEYIKPESGKEFIKINIKIENKSNEKISYGTWDWEVQDSDGDIQNVASISYSTDGALNSGDLAPGGKKTGDLYFEVPKDDSGLILHYKSSFWSSRTIKIKL